MKKPLKPLLILGVMVGILIISIPTSASAASDCSWYDLPCQFINLIGIVANLWLAILGSLVWLTGLLFDLSIYLSVTNFKSFVETSGMAQVGWSLFRDMANISFIFIILYIAISTILQLGSDKRLLAKVIIIALLINFSGLITKLVIDVSNVVANQFYSQLNTSNNPFSENNISGKLVAGFKFGQQFKEPTPSTFKESSGKKEGLFDIVVGVIGKSILILITAFLLLAGAVMFFLRTFTLIFLIIVSPLAFMAYAFPGLGSYFKKWWSKLFSQAFFAPLFLAFIFITVKAIKVSGSVVVPSGSGTSWTNTAQNLMGTMVNFLIVGGMMLGSLIMASKLGMAGASQMTKLGHNLRGRAQAFAGRSTFGRASRRIAESKVVNWAERKSPRIGGTLRNIAEYGAKQKFGGKISYEDEIKQQTKAAERYKDDPEKQAEYIKNLGRNILRTRIPGLDRLPGIIKTNAQAGPTQTQRAVFEKLKPDNQVKLVMGVEKAKKQAQDEVKTESELLSELNTLSNTADNRQLLLDHEKIKNKPVSQLTNDELRLLDKYDDYKKQKTRLEQAATLAPKNEMERKKKQNEIGSKYDQNIITRVRTKMSAAVQGTINKLKKEKDEDDEFDKLENIPKDQRDRNPIQKERYEELKPKVERRRLIKETSEAAKAGVREAKPDEEKPKDKKE